MKKINNEMPLASVSFFFNTCIQNLFNQKCNNATFWIKEYRIKVYNPINQNFIFVQCPNKAF